MVMPEYLMSLIPYIPLVSFIGAFIGGENFLIFMSILASQGAIPFWTMFLFFTLGIFASDSFWFFVGKLRILGHLKKLLIHKSAKKMKQNIDKHIENNPFMFLLVSKFTYGIRIVSIMYLGRRGIKFSRFFIYNLIITPLLIGIISLIGWLAGKGLLEATKTVTSFKVLVFLILILTALVYLLLHFLFKYISSRIKNEK